MGLKLKQIEKKKRMDSGFSFNELLTKEITLFGSSFGLKKKEVFYGELAILLNSGIRLKEALYLIAESEKKEKDKTFFQEMADKLVEGKNLSQILEEDKRFTTYEQYSVRIGEQSGTLNQVTTSLANFYQLKNEQRRNLISAITYPAIVLFTAFVAVIFMLQFVVPMFKDVFKQNNVELPALTNYIINISEWIAKYGWTIIFILLPFLLLRYYYKKEFWYRNARDKFLMKVPFLGSFLRLSSLAKFTQATSLLVSAMVSIPRSLHLAKDMVDFVPLEHALNEVEQEILKGTSLSESLKMQPYFDPKMIALIRVAEETNQTEYVFNKLNTQYNQEVLQKSKQFATILEPFIIVIVGIIVATILIAMYLPMFELGNIIK